MNNYKVTLGAVLGTIIIVVVGLFFVCSQKPALQDEDFAFEDLNGDQFNQELIDLLDLTETTPEQQESADTTAQDADILTMLGHEEDSSTGETVQPKTSGSSDEGINEDMIKTMRSKADRLNGLVAKRMSTADSLRRIIEQKKARIAELEKLVAEAQREGQTARVSRTAPSSSSRVSSSAAVNFTQVSAFMKKYQNARNLFENFRYREATAAFENLVGEYPNHPMADNCQYWIGECYFGLKQYQQAALEFQKVFAYDKKDKYDDAQLMIGLAYYRSGERDKARYEFETFLANYSGSEYAAIAERYMKRI